MKKSGLFAVAFAVAATFAGQAFAMPTANAMFDRLAQSWLALYQADARPSLVLAHSARSAA